MATTALGPLGIAQRPFGSFAGKVEAVSRITQLCGMGIPMRRYGAFAGKAEAVPEIDARRAQNPMLASTGRLMSR